MSDTEVSDSGSSGDSAPSPSSEPVSTTPADPTPAPSKPESLRDTMARAIEAKESGAEPPKGKTAAERARDDAGRFANAPKVKPGAKPAQPSSTASLAAPSPVTSSNPALKPEGEAPPALKAPQSWKPLAREKWASLPPEVQAEAVRIESETKQALQGASQYKRLAEGFQQALAPLDGAFRARGLDPMQHIGATMQTESRLASGSPWEKAQTVAEIISRYGADVDLVSKALTGQAPPQGQQTQGQQPGGYQDPRVDQLLGMLQQQSQAQRQQSQVKLAQTIQDWSKDKEFFEDLRDDMAQFHDVAHARGQSMTFDQSYAAALSMPQHEQIRQILEQRKAATAATAQAAQVQKQRAASSSIRSQPVTPLRNGARPTDIRSTISSLFDAASSDG